MRRTRLIPLLAAALLALPEARAEDPDAFDPILDGAAPTSRGGGDRIEVPDPRSPGFTIGGGLAVYTGFVRSFLTTDQSRLETGTRPGVAIHLGYRTRSPFEIDILSMLGLGLTFDPDLNKYVFAFDLVLEPSLRYHLFEGERWSFYVGASGAAYLFDLEGDGLNQAGIGPAGVIGVHRRVDRHALVYLETSVVALHDFLAFETIEPSAEALAMDPTLEATRDEGAWYPVVRVSLGYRLTAF
ncbi:MAG: hypothetical protein ACYTF3_11195 [Planctomycetota bacterium]|jgi:hypothetical protein